MSRRLPNLVWFVTRDVFRHRFPHSVRPLPNPNDVQQGAEVIVQLANHLEIWTCDTSAIGKVCWRTNGDTMRRGTTPQDRSAVIRWAWTTERRWIR